MESEPEPDPESDSAWRLRQAQAARAEAEAAEGRLSFLAEVSHALSSSLDYRESLSLLARLVVPEIADYCVIDVFDEAGQIQRVESLHADPARQPLMDGLRRFPPALGAPAGVGRTLRTGQPNFILEVDDGRIAEAVPDPEHRRLLLAIGPRSSLIVPLLSRGRILGAVSLAYTGDRGDRRYSTADCAMAEELGMRAALAIDNARLFQQAEQSLEELARADRSKDEFLAMLAHELRNPLAAIANAGQALHETCGEDGRSRELLGVIGRQIRHLTRLVDDLLDVSRFTRGSIELRKVPVEVRRAVEGAVETARPLIEQRRHTVTVALPAEPLWLEADATRLEQVLANLLTNAAKFTDEGGTIHLTAERAGGELVLRVRDNGAGIPADLLPRIFDLFVQENRSLARTHGGLGIGLTLARSLVELHGGRMEARSGGPGQGTEMTVRLPLLAGAPPLPAPPAAAVPAAEPEAARVLLVEDNADAAGALAELLRLWGHAVAVAGDGSGALAAAQTHRPQVVLLDIGLPGMDGYQVAAALRALPELGRPLMVALTGYGQESDRQRSRAAGFDHHLVKPVDLEHLRTLVAGSAIPQS